MQQKLVLLFVCILASYAGSCYNHTLCFNNYNNYVGNSAQVNKYSNYKKWKMGMVQKARRQDRDDRVNVMQLDDGNFQALLALPTTQPTPYCSHVITLISKQKGML